MDESVKQLIFVIWISIGILSLIFTVTFDILRNDSTFFTKPDAMEILCIISLIIMGPIGGFIMIISIITEYKERRKFIKKTTCWWELREYGGWK
jgi:uncharacterized membrane-anchored protein